MRQILAFLVFLSLIPLSAQRVSTVKALLEGSSLIIQYTMEDLIEGQQFRVRLFASHNDYSQPILSGVTGAVGDEVRLSAINRIEIPSPLKTFGKLSDPITFQVSTQLIYSPVVVQKPKDGAVVTRGGKLKLGWKGGLDSDQVAFDLYRNDILIREDIYTNPTNTRNASVPVPKKMALGSGYRVDMRVESLEEPVSFSNIRVKRKFSIFERVLASLVVVTAADYFLNPNSIIYYQILGKKDPLPEPPALPNIQ